MTKLIILLALFATVAYLSTALGYFIRTVEVNPTKMKNKRMRKDAIINSLKWPTA